MRSIILALLAAATMGCTSTAPASVQELPASLEVVARPKTVPCVALALMEHYTVYADSEYQDTDASWTLHASIVGIRFTPKDLEMVAVRFAPSVQSDSVIDAMAQYRYRPATHAEAEAFVHKAGFTMPIPYIVIALGDWQVEQKGTRQALAFIFTENGWQRALVPYATALKPGVVVLFVNDYEDPFATTVKE